MSRAGVARSMENGRPLRVAAMCRDGAQWRLVIVERNGSIRLIEERSVPYGDLQAVRAALDAHSVTTLLRIAPAAQVVCRLVEIPEGPEAELIAAASLMAEAELPGGVDPHRRSAGLVGLRASPEHRAIVMAAWLGDEVEPVVGAAEERWTAEPVALLSLLAPGASRWVVASDRENGSIAIACSGNARSALRTLREDGPDPSRWSEAVNEQVRRTITSVGGQAPDEGLDLGALRIALDAESAAELPEGVRSFATTQGKSSSRSNVLIALGAALGYLRAESASRGLFEMTARAPASERALWVRVAAWLAIPKHAAAVIGVALLVMLLAPLASAMARHAILEAKSGGLERQRQSERDIDMQVAFYKELDARRWPMTKLTADIARLLPVGISAESIRMDQGQRIALRGRAESLELISTLQGAVNASGVFAEASIDRQQMSEARNGSGAGFEFDLSARVVRPFEEVRGAEDYAERSLAQRLYGDRAGASGAGDSGAARAESARTERSGRAAVRGARSGEASRERETAAAPDPVTDADIEAMDRATAMKEWTRRQSASRDTKFDEATRERLKAEAEKAKARFTALKGGT